MKARVCYLTFKDQFWYARRVWSVIRNDVDCLNGSIRRVTVISGAGKVEVFNLHEGHMVTLFKW